MDDKMRLIKGMFLGLGKTRGRKAQIDFLRDLYNEHGFAAYLQVVKIALEAPITEGGIPTEELQALAVELGMG